MDNRYLLSKSDIFKAFEAKGTTYDLSLLDKANYINLKEIEHVLMEIRTRNFPLTTLVLNALETGRIVLSRSTKPGSSIQMIPALSDKGVKVDRMFVNCALIVKPTKIVDPNTGDIKESVTIKSYEDLYNILLGAYVGLNADKVITNMSVAKEVAEVYVDIIAQMFSRGMGNPIDGDRFRFIMKVYFFNGAANGEELANLFRYNIDSVRLMSSKHPDFFSHKPKTLQQLLEVIEAEFNSLKNVTVSNVVSECVKAFGSNGVFFLDNYPYMLAMITCRTRKDRSGMFNGYLLKVIDPYGRKILSDLLSAVL